MSCVVACGIGPYQENFSVEYRKPSTKFSGTPDKRWNSNPISAEIPIRTVSRPPYHYTGLSGTDCSPVFLKIKYEPKLHTSKSLQHFDFIQWVSDTDLLCSEICLVPLEVGWGVKLGSGHMWRVALCSPIHPNMTSGVCIHCVSVGSGSGSAQQLNTWPKQLR